MAIDFLLLISRQGKVRLAKYYVPYTRKEKARTEREVSNYMSSVFSLSPCQSVLRHAVLVDRQIFHKSFKLAPCHNLSQTRHHINFCVCNESILILILTQDDNHMRNSRRVQVVIKINIHSPKKSIRVIAVSYTHLTLPTRRIV